MNLVIRHALDPHHRHGVAQDVVVSPPAIFPPLVLIPDVRGNENLSTESGLDELDDFVDPLVVRRQINAPLL